MSNDRVNGSMCMEPPSNFEVLSILYSRLRNMYEHVDTLDTPVELQLSPKERELLDKGVKIGLRGAMVCVADMVFFSGESNT